MTFEISAEDADSPGVRAMIYAAEDELARRYGPGADAEHLQLDELVAPRGAFVVARLDGHLAGGVGVRALGPLESHTGEVKRLWVRPDLRRRGLAVALMDQIIIEARGLAQREIYLETGPLQPEAVAFYEATGWRRVDAFPAGVFSHDSGLKFHRALDV